MGGIKMKPFNLKEAKAGKPVCTRDGRRVRIICFDRCSACGYNIVALVDCYNEVEEVITYSYDGTMCGVASCDINDYGLMMVGDKYEGWVNIYRDEQGLEYTGNDVYKTKEDAMDAAEIGCVATIKIEWEE